MTRTMWIAVFCLVTLIASIAIRVATPSASSSVEAASDQRKTDMATAPNESAKSDRLELRDIRAETEIMPAAQAEPAEAGGAGGSTVHQGDQDSPQALARFQRQGRSLRVISSPYNNQRVE
jgi:hypothetical protein